MARRFVALIVLLGCAGESPNRATPASASAPARTASCADALPKADMIRDNIADTSITGIGEIVAASRTGTDGGTPAPTTGYVDNAYELRVVKWLSGTGPEKLVLHQGAEADIEQRPEIEKMGETAAKRANAIGKRKRACRRPTK